MRPNDSTWHHKLKAETYADLAKKFRDSKDWERMRHFLEKARAEWLRVQWDRG